MYIYQLLTKTLTIKKNEIYLKSIYIINILYLTQENRYITLFTLELFKIRN
jgi:hypothetical protein